MAIAAIAGVVALQAEQRLLIAAAATVDGDRDRDAAGALGALDVMRGDFELVGGVELEPDRRPARSGRILDRGGRLRREDLQVVADLGGARNAALAVGVIALVPASRRDHDRRVIFLSEQLDAGVDLADVDQAARTQPALPEA